LATNGDQYLAIDKGFGRPDDERALAASPEELVGVPVPSWR
jgi:hypothetical protein